MAVSDERRRAQGRARWHARRERALYGRCSSCDEPLGSRNASGRCRDCRSADARDRAQRIVDAWLAGDFVVEIATRERVSNRVVSVTLERLRAAGLPIPRRHANPLARTVRWIDPVPVRLTVEAGMLSRGAQQLRDRARERKTNPTKEAPRG